MTNQTIKISLLFGMLLVIAAVICSAQDYDDENQGGHDNQGDNDGYGNGYNNEDGYNQRPNYQNQNVDSEGSNNNPSSYSPQGGSDADGDYEGDDGTAASNLSPTIVRVRRSTDVTEAKDSMKPAVSSGHLRVKRHGKYYIGPVYTYVKTDKHANFKWGVKHKVGKKHG